MPWPLAVDPMEVLVLEDDSTDRLSISPADAERETPRTTAFETGMAGHVRLGYDGSTWEPDPLVRDERFVAVRVAGRGAGQGLFVGSARSHAGIVDVRAHAQALRRVEPLYGVLGGRQRSGTAERVVPQTVDALRTFGLTRIAPAHCTGWRAVAALASAFGDAVSPSAVGKSYRP